METNFKSIYRAVIKKIKSPGASPAKAWLKKRSLSAQRSQAGYNSRAGSYFKKRSVVFPLRDEQKKIVNFCAMSLDNDTTEFLNKQGIYPCYPDLSVEKLFIVETVLDGATILESGLLKEKEAVMVIPDGEVLDQHRFAIDRLTGIKEIIYITNKE